MDAGHLYFNMGNHCHAMREMTLTAWLKTVCRETESTPCSVGIGTRYGLDGPGDRILVRGEIFRTRPD